MNKNLTELLSIKSSNVNLLKFICAILVIIGHSGSITGEEIAFPTEFGGYICGPGGFAVSVFFFLSGLYVTKSLSKTVNLRAYIAKRIERIFPQLFIVVLLSTFVLGPVLTSLSIGEYFTSASTYLYLLNSALIPVHNLPGVFASLPYQTVNGPLWTLPVEFACYLMLWGMTLVIVLFTKHWNNNNLSEIVESMAFRVILWVAEAIVLLAFAAVYFVLKQEFLVSVIRPIAIFIEGSLLYQYREKIKVNYIVGLVMIALLVLSLFTGWFSIGMILFLPYIILSLTLGLPQIKVDWTMFKVSYEMYLIGWPIQQILLTVFNGGMMAYQNAILTIPFDIILAVLLYKSIGTVISRLSKRIIR